MKWLTLLVVTLSAPALLAAEQGSSCQPLASLVVPQRNYSQVNVPAFEGRVYVYVPDIKSGWGGGFEAFNFWIVEGVYGKPFMQPSGSLDVAAFEQIRNSRNVLATAVPVERNAGPKRTPFTVGKQQYVLDLVKVNTSLGGTDSVTVNICR